MNSRRVVAVVVTTLTSLWLAGCAADGDPAEIESDPASTSASPSLVAHEGIDDRLDEHAFVFPPLVVTPKNERADRTPENLPEIREREDVSPCLTLGTVLCSCGVCADVAACIPICDGYLNY